MLNIKNISENYNVLIKVLNKYFMLLLLNELEKYIRFNLHNKQINPIFTSL